MFSIVSSIRAGITIKRLVTFKIFQYGFLNKMSNSTSPIINTTHGPIKGRSATSIYGDAYYSFEKVPFAQPPLNELRFKAPVFPKQWTEVLDCTQNPDKAMQLNYSNEIEGSEDCLYLNIYTKKLHSTKPLPIMVFIHGGGFEKGDPVRGPDYFMMRDVVMITIAYRLGPLGFLSLKDPLLQVPGNAGLKDQLLALQWIKNNAGNFNGDCDNITLFGESAGGVSVHYLLLTPHAEGLFHKAIIMSGVVFCSWALSTINDLTYRLALKMGYKGPQKDSEVIEFFRKAKPEELFHSQLLTREELMNDLIFAFTPSIEPYESDKCIIPKHPRELLQNAWGNKIPIMIGGTSNEGLLMYGRAKAAPFLIDYLNTKPEHLLPAELKGKFNAEKIEEMAKRIKRTHFDGKAISSDNLLQYCDYITYKVFWNPIMRSVVARMRSDNPAPTYLYRFDFDSPTFNHHRIKYCGNECRGVAHADELSYIFYGDYASKLEPQTAEFKTIVRMIDLWTNFAEKSDPNCEHTKNQLHWKPLTNEKDQNCLNISTELSIMQFPEPEKLAVWDSLFTE